MIALAMLAIMPANAKVTKEYQRPSLHMILLNTDEPTSEAVADLLPVVNDSWTDYEFPHLYNQFTIPTAVVDGGKPKGNMVELITRYGDAEKLKTMTMEEIAELQSLMAGKQYNADLQARCDSMSNEVAHQLLTRWFNITPEGRYDCDTIFYYACYSAQQVAAADAAANTETGAQMSLYNELMEPTIANTYVSFSKLAYYDNEPIAAFVRDLAIAAGVIADQAGAGGYASLAATAAAKIAYEATKNGYSAYTTTLLYRLAWNDSISQAFNALLTPDDKENPWTGTINLAAFNAMNFKMEFLSWALAPRDEKGNIRYDDFGNVSYEPTKMKPVVDFGIGFEYLINKNFSAFATINNIGCQYYARYYDFNSFGINALVGITYSFGKESIKNKKK